ncbi:MAG: hypothetical protein IKE23_00855 [Exiguobacterium sp.]|nr:hypothetical protein [Exiguobacterium sp.]
MIYTGLTPTYTLTFPAGTDLTQAEDIVVTITDEREYVLVEIPLSDLAITENTITFSLTQAQTLKFPSTVLVQANWIYHGGAERNASYKHAIDFETNLKKEVME